MWVRIVADGKPGLLSAEELSVSLAPHEAHELLTVKVVEGELLVLRERPFEATECVYSEVL